MFPIGVQDDDQKLAGRTSPRSHSPISSRHSATQARRLCYLRLGDVPYAPASHRSLGASLHQVTKLLSLTLTSLISLDSSSQIALAKLRAAP